MLIAQDITKSYPTPRGPVPVLSHVNLELNCGDAASIMGPSGSGKSTLLYIIGVLESPTSGAITLDGQNPFDFSEKTQSAFRNKNIGFVFQDHCLLPQCSVLENVLVPTLVAQAKDDFGNRALQLLEQVGLSDRLHHLPGELSGGEKQRVAIARSLVMQPQVMLCDEPTGNLDRKSAENVASLLLDLHRRQNTILVVVTHSMDLADRFPIRYEMVDQALVRR
jgi:lipoprotein-releasing system ATP-binding protein